MQFIKVYLSWKWGFVLKDIFSWESISKSLAIRNDFLLNWDEICFHFSVPLFVGFGNEALCKCEVTLLFPLLQCPLICTQSFWFPRVAAKRFGWLSHYQLPPSAWMCVRLVVSCASLWSSVFCRIGLLPGKFKTLTNLIISWNPQSFPSPVTMASTKISEEIEPRQMSCPLDALSLSPNEVC